MARLKCIVCGQWYETCNCSRDNITWKKFCDTSNHYQLFLVLNDYVHGNINKDGARNMIDRLDTTGWENWEDNGSKKTVKELLDIDQQLEMPLPKRGSFNNRRSPSSNVAILTNEGSPLSEVEENVNTETDNSENSIADESKNAVLKETNNVIEKE